MVYVSRLSQWIEKRWNAKGGHVIDDIDVVSKVVLPWPVGVEDRYLQGWNRFSFVTNVAAVAAQFSRLRFRNPTGSQVIAVVEQLSIFSGTGADQPFVTWVTMNNNLAGTVPSLALSAIDNRGNPSPTMIISTNQQAASGQAFIQRSFSAAGITADYINTLDQELPVVPNFGIDIQANTANSALTISIMWRERALELSELT